MLDVQAVGDIFAAPNGQLVFDAMKLADKGHGVLLLTLNYAGDQLAGKQAMKLAKKAGLNVRQVAVSYTHLDVYKRQKQILLLCIF